MKLADLHRIRLAGKRPQHGLVIVREPMTAKGHREDLIITERDRKADFGAVYGLVVLVELASWMPWVFAVLERICAARPELVEVRDPVSGCLLTAYHQGERLPIALRRSDWQTARHPAAERIRDEQRALVASCWSMRRVA